MHKTEVYSLVYFNIFIYISDHHFWEMIWNKGVDNGSITQLELEFMQNPSTENHQPEVFLSSLGVGDGQGGLECCDSWGLQRVRHDWATELTDWLMSRLLPVLNLTLCLYPLLRPWRTRLAAVSVNLDHTHHLVISSAAQVPLNVFLAAWLSPWPFSSPALAFFASFPSFLCLPSLLFFSIVCFSLFGLWFSSTT